MYFLTISSLSYCGTSAEPAHPIKIGANRGANRLAPENTMAAVKAAIAAGATYLSIDVRRSADGVYYAFSEPTVERTTNGTGSFSQLHSSVIDTLDAGSWFSHRFRGERIPRLETLLTSFQHGVHFILNCQEGEARELVRLVQQYGKQSRCFFAFSDSNEARVFRKLAPKLFLKLTVKSPSQVDSLLVHYQPQMLETSFDNFSDALAQTCKRHGLKLMVSLPGDDWTAYEQVLGYNVEIVSVDNPDVFGAMQRSVHPLKAVPYRLIAHRGGIVEKRFTEYDPRSLEAAVDRGYWMLEVDVWRTKDGVLVLHHDDNLMRIYGHAGRISELTWGELQSLRAIKAGYGLMKLEEVAARCKGKVRLMIDRKPPQPTEAYYKELARILQTYDLLTDSYFIDKQAIPYFWGKARFGFRLSELPRIKEMIQNGEDVACHYFLFDHGNVLSSDAIRWCQQHSIAVVPSINIFHYRYENHMRGAERDINFLKACGVREFQIDSNYDDWLNARNSQ